LVTYNFDQIVERKYTNSIKWEYYHDYIPSASADSLPLWVADMDFPCAEPIVKALQKRIDCQIFGYSYYRTDQYMEAVTGWFKRRFDWEIESSSVFYSPGIVTAVAVLIKILTKPGEGILIQRPVYYPFADKIEANNRVIINNPLQYANSKYSVDFADLERKIADLNTGGMILCSPHNPVGHVFSMDELLKIVEICSRHNKWIIADEIHADLIRNGVTHYPLEKVALHYKEQIITCTSPSKTFNMPGLKISNIIINNPAYQEAWLREVNDSLSIGMANPLSIKAVEAAYNEGEEWLNQLKDYLDQNIEFAAVFIKDNLPKAKLIYPAGTYLLWIDLRAYCSDHQILENLMLNEAKLILDQGYFFGDEGRGFERINAACPRSILEECLQRMTKALLSGKKA
jgi:cysteine-S-conjugate beta-lyase